MEDRNCFETDKFKVQIYPDLKEFEIEVKRNETAITINRDEYNALGNLFHRITNKIDF